MILKKISLTILVLVFLSTTVFADIKIPTTTNITLTLNEKPLNTDANIKIECFGTQWFPSDPKPTNYTPKSIFVLEENCTSKKCTSDNSFYVNYLKFDYCNATVKTNSKTYVSKKFAKSILDKNIMTCKDYKTNNKQIKLNTRQCNLLIKLTKPTMTQEEAKTIAENSSCTKEGTIKKFEGFNENSETFWFTLKTNKKNCSPACVVSKKTKTAEINWRCTGLIKKPTKEPKTPTVIKPEKSTVVKPKTPVVVKPKNKEQPSFFTGILQAIGCFFSSLFGKAC